VVNDLRVPPVFATRAPRVLGPEAVPWLTALPDLAARYAREWGLTFEGEAMHGYVGVVQPARLADGTLVVLKLGWRDAESADEPVALSTWAGRGAVLLLDSAPGDGVLLLERLGGVRGRQRRPGVRSDIWAFAPVRGAPPPGRPQEVMVPEIAAWAASR
jgi:streptomycin 6-kinase